MKYLSRNKIYEKVDSFKNAKKVYLFCEGDKEVNYFKFFQGFASNIDIIPIPNDNGKSDPIKLKENSEMLFRFFVTFGEISYLVINKENKNDQEPGVLLNGNFIERVVIAKNMSLK
jgi:hypothetical protein